MPETDTSPAPRRALGISVENLRKSFGSTEVLKGISLEVKPGEIFVMMGPSGSGKSVFLKHLAGLEIPTEGKVRIDDINVADDRERPKVRLALVFQAGALFNSLSVFDNLALYPREHRLYDRKTIKEKVEKALAMLSLSDAAEKIPAELSGGMKKRVAIARALVMEPDLLLYDEPTSELDPIMAATISEIIADLREEFGVTSLVVSHDRDLAMTIGDRVGIMQEGELLAIDTPAGIRQMDDPRIKEFLNPAIDLKNPRFKRSA
ncbi:MAG: ATP-binding cassette domain-containing protein [Opitutales bacterium]|nr:ATP-binding cassette domain-containing protein [Opitutales bacterium]MCH8541719.1 ATP-binding cassette domain-containing protein [Opitutales bacterium]